MVHLSGVVAAATAPLALAALLLRRALPLPVALVLWHASACGTAVALAASERFGPSTTWLLGKRPDGALAPLAAAAFWPYHVGLRGKLAVQRRVSTEPAWNAVTPDYFLGGWPSERALVPEAGVAVVDVTCELPLAASTAPSAYLALPVWDTHAPALAQIDAGVAFVRAQVAAGRKVLVHCAHGHGRSAVLLGAVLIADGEAADADVAVALMRRARPRVRLNRRQRTALEKWAAARVKAS